MDDMSICDPGYEYCREYRAEIERLKAALRAAMNDTPREHVDSSQYDVECLRRALTTCGISAPASDEELALNFASWMRRILYHIGSEHTQRIIVERRNDHSALYESDKEECR